MPPPGGISSRDWLYAVAQLSEYGLIDWSPLEDKSGMGLLSGFAKINDFGVKVLQGSVEPPIQISIDEARRTAVPCRTGRRGGDRQCLDARGGTRDGGRGPRSCAVSAAFLLDTCDQLASVPSKSIVACLPSQNGLFEEPPQRQMATGSGCSITALGSPT